MITIPLNAARRFGVREKAEERVQRQLFRQPWQDGPLLCSSPGQHHSKDGAASVEARKTVCSYVRWCSPPPPQVNRSPSVGGTRRMARGKSLNVLYAASGPVSCLMMQSGAHTRVQLLSAVNQEHLFRLSHHPRSHFQQAHSTGRCSHCPLWRLRPRHPLARQLLDDQCRCIQRKHPHRCWSPT